MTTTPKPPRRGLGRGLGSLIPTAPPETNEPSGWAGTPSPNGASRSDVTSPTAPGSDASSPSDASSSSDAAGTVSGAYFAELPITQVRPNARQPRQVFEEEALAELVHSITEVGLLQPVVVRRTGESEL